MPKLKGKTMCLSDNSGSAWGGVISEFGKTVVAEIDNLSAVIAGACSDEGYVGKFGNELRVFPVSKRDGIISQTRTITKDRYEDVGADTEGGIWIFFRDAINNKDWYDNIFIFSDMQAGTGGLYGTSRQMYEYEKWGVKAGYHNIDVYKLIQMYRSKVNPKVNVFCVQTAGYNNILVPAMSYRCAMLTGWTGKEILFADKYISQWDEIEAKKEAERKAREAEQSPVDKEMSKRRFKSKSEERRVRTQLQQKLDHESKKNFNMKDKMKDKKYNKK
jgi:hypothetical protein